MTHAATAPPRAEATGGATGGAPGGTSSLLACLVIAARHHGIHLSVAQLVHDHLLGPGDPPAEAFLGIARASGLRATLASLEWRDLMRLGKALPAIR